MRKEVSKWLSKKNETWDNGEENKGKRGVGKEGRRWVWRVDGVKAKLQIEETWVGQSKKGLDQSMQNSHWKGQFKVKTVEHALWWIRPNWCRHCFFLGFFWAWLSFTYACVYWGWWSLQPHSPEYQRLHSGQAAVASWQLKLFEFVWSEDMSVTESVLGSYS